MDLPQLDLEHDRCHEPGGPAGRQRPATDDHSSGYIGLRRQVNEQLAVVMDNGTMLRCIAIFAGLIVSVICSSSHDVIKQVRHLSASDQFLNILRQTCTFEKDAT